MCRFQAPTLPIASEGVGVPSTPLSFACARARVRAGRGSDSRVPLSGPDTPIASEGEDGDLPLRQLNFTSAGQQ